MQLTREVKLQLREICTDVAQVSLAGIAVPYFLDKDVSQLAFLGVAAAFVFWIFSLILAYFSSPQ